MASVKIGSLITDISGKLGGQVFQKNGSGLIIRNNYKGSNGVSFAPKQQTYIFEKIGYLWGLLSYEQKEVWNVNAYQYPVLNKFGESITLSGYAVFSMLNSQLLQCNGSSIDDFIEPLPPMEALVFSFYSDIASNKLDVTFDPTPVPADTGFILRWWRARKRKPLSDEELNNVGVLKAAAGAGSPISIWSDYDAQMFGPLHPSDIGKEIPFKAVQVNLITGQTSTPVWYSHILS